MSGIFNKLFSILSLSSVFVLISILGNRFSIDADDYKLEASVPIVYADAVQGGNTPPEIIDNGCCGCDSCQ